MYPTITEPELVQWLDRIRDGQPTPEGMAPATVNWLKTLNALLEQRVSVPQFKAALVTTYIKGRKDEAEVAGMAVTSQYLLQTCRGWIRDNAISQSQFEMALLQMGYPAKALKKKGYRQMAKALWPEPQPRR